MSSICIINGYTNAVSETFIQAHIEQLNGPVAVLNNYYPEYTHKGRLVRCFYHRSPLLAKLLKLLPHFLYHRLIIQKETSYKRTHEFLGAFFRAHKVDVVLAEYGFNGADIYPHLKDFGIPLIVHFHGHDAHREPDIAPYLEKFKGMFEYAHRIISVSHFMTETLIRMGADPEKIVYNPYGPRDYFFNNESDYRSTLLAIGRFADIKAPYLTLMAFREALKTCPNAKLIMVGDGPLREVCISLSRMWEIDQSVSFPGAMRHEQTRPLFSQACAFVQHSVTTSYGDAEGTPVAILEAQAAALPVISTYHAGIVDAVVDGTTGFLVKERDLPAMTLAMTRLLQDSQLAARMGCAARQHIRENYALSRHINQLDTLVIGLRSTSQ